MRRRVPKKGKKVQGDGGVGSGGKESVREKREPGTGLDWEGPSIDVRLDPAREKSENLFEMERLLTGGKRAVSI